ncbi:hypothetical protein F2P81_008460 [Scophthalmus maximus]|uniref:Uncharacterized protein n=1 Tax=Scophthalmus maximus TaxID=52904 RepID=A0A6A4T538_SCOMX|nr:hypothetical protein F2P81_008460 [Scophthalmus maximus]
MEEKIMNVKRVRACSRLEQRLKTRIEPAIQNHSSAVLMLTANSNKAECCSKQISGRTGGATHRVTGLKGEQESRSHRGHGPDDVFLFLIRRVRTNNLLRFGTVTSCPCPGSKRPHLSEVELREAAQELTHTTQQPDGSTEQNRLRQDVSTLVSDVTIAVDVKKKKKIKCLSETRPASIRTVSMATSIIIISAVDVKKKKKIKCLSETRPASIRTVSMATSIIIIRCL